GSDENLTVDHKKELSLGGKNIMSNLQTLCKDCHEDKHYNKFLDRGFDADDDYGENHEPTKKITAINRAIDRGESITIDYVDKYGNRIHRSVYPRKIYKGFDKDGVIVHRKAVYVEAYCKLREDKRSFRI